MSKETILSSGTTILSNAKIYGIRNESPQFKSSDNGMFSPSENPKHISTDKTDYIKYDLLGKSRGKIKTLGALQFSNSLTHTILKEIMVSFGQRIKMLQIALQYPLNHVTRVLIINSNGLLNTILSLLG